MLNNLMNIINGLETRVFVDESDCITTNDINEYGFVTIRNNELLMFNGVAIAMALFLKFDNIDNYVPMIVVDDGFMCLSENCRKFVIGHELGHLNLHATKDKLFNIEYVRNINDEFEADEYVAKQIGYPEAIVALKELQEVLDKTSNGQNVAGIQEVEIRMRNLIYKCNSVTC